MCNVPKIVEFIDTESRMVVARGRDEGKMENCFLKGTAFHFCKMKRVLEMNGADGFTTM